MDISLYMYDINSIVDCLSLIDGLDSLICRLDRLKRKLSRPAPAKVLAGLRFQARPRHQTSMPRSALVYLLLWLAQPAH